MNNKNKLSFNNIFFLYIKMANDYFQKHKEKLQKEARAIYQNCSEKKKNGKKVREKYQNYSEEENAKQSQYHFWETKAKASWVCENLLFSI